MRGQLEQTYTSPDKPSGWSLLSMEFTTLDMYRLFFWSGSLDDPSLILHTVNPTLEPFHFHRYHCHYDGEVHPNRQGVVPSHA
jgi:hypothetical protein